MQQIIMSTVNSTSEQSGGGKGARRCCYSTMYDKYAEFLAFYRDPRGVTVVGPGPSPQKP